MEAVVEVVIGRLELRSLAVLLICSETNANLANDNGGSDGAGRLVDHWPLSMKTTVDMVGRS